MFEITVDAMTAVRHIAGATEQLPYALSRSINQVAAVFQDRERDHVRAMFHLRRPPWVLQSIKIPRKTWKTDASIQETVHNGAPLQFVEVQIDPTRNVLAKFEEGGVKRAKSGGAMAIPVQARPAGELIVPKQLWPKNLRLALHRTAKGKAQFKGERRTFLVERATFDWYIFQRIGRGAGSSLKLLYRGIRAVPLPASLRFRAIAEATVQREWPRIFAERFDQAMRTAK